MSTQLINNPYNKTFNQTSSCFGLFGTKLTSTIPLTDAKLHILDGSLLTGAGVYKEFVQYMSSLVDIYPEIFCTQEQYDQSITNYGICDKYVYDNTENTIRLPKYENNDRYLIKSGRNQNSSYSIYSDGYCEQNYRISAGQVAGYTLIFDTPFISLADIQITDDAGSSAGVQSYAADISTFNGNSIKMYCNTSANFTCNASFKGYVDVTAYQKNHFYYYVVLANSSETNIQVDINNIAADLQLKADKDLTNTTPSQVFKDMSMGWDVPDTTRAIDISSLSTYTFPCEGWLQLYILSPGGAEGYAYYNSDKYTGNYKKAYRISSYGSGKLSVTNFYRVEKGETVIKESLRADASFVLFIPCKGAEL